jgi:hypothetical protein
VVKWLVISISLLTVLTVGAWNYQAHRASENGCIKTLQEGYPNFAGSCAP